MPELTEAQKAIRGSRIGASELGALLPPYIHPWTSPDLIYARIHDGPEEPVTNAFMRAGHILERAIGHAARDEIGLSKVHACSQTYIHPELPLAATPDFWAWDYREPIGKAHGLLEIKLSREWSDWLDGPPPFISWQVRAQLALTKRPWAWVGALVGTTLQTYRLERDQALEDELLDAVYRFNRDHLEPGIPPHTINERLMLRWHLRPGELIAGGALEDAGDEYAHQIRNRRRVEAWEKEARARFVKMLAAWPGAELVLGNGWNAKIDERGTLRFDAKRRADE